MSPLTKRTRPALQPDERLLTAGLTLIALGLSVLFLNSWDNLFVRTSVGLFWGAYFLALNWPVLVSFLRSFRQSNGFQRRSSQ
jgi:hypothetical protein